MTIESKIETVRNMSEVASVKIWREKRAYINLTSCDKSFAGNRNHQFYIDMQSGDLVDILGKGTTSGAFDDQRKAVSAALEA